MLKSEEILNSINTKMEEIKELTGDEKVAMYDEIMALKNDYEIEKKLEKEEIQNLENKIIENESEDFKMENKMELINKEERIFANYVKTAIKNDMKAGTNGAIIPASISSRIIEKVKEISPLYTRATKFNMGGDLIFVKENAIPTTDYMDELAPASGTDATFTTVKLTSFIARALTKVSRSLINKTDFDLVEYVINAIAKSIALFLEKELINGTSSKITGLSDVNKESATKLDADALIDLQMAVPSSLQAGCEWLVNPADLKVIRKLKGADGQFLLNSDATAEFGYRILGKNVMVSDQVPANTLFYGDFSGLYVKLTNNLEVNVLLEKYADEYAVGVVGFVELDAKVVEAQKIKAIRVTE